MLVSFNQNINYKPSFNALSAEQIAAHTRNFGIVQQFETDITRGAIRLDDADKLALKVEQILNI